MNSWHQVLRVECPQFGPRANQKLKRERVTYRLSVASFSPVTGTKRHMSAIRTNERQFSSGLDIVPQAYEALAPLPLRTDVGPADIPARSEMDQLFFLPDMNDVILQALQPEISSLDILRPARFLESLHAAPRELRLAAQRLPRAARALGTAASLVSDEIGRRNQVWLLQAALRQI
jgi:hypothetical protein